MKKSSASNKLRYVPADFKYHKTYRLNDAAIKVIANWRDNYCGRKHPLTLDRLVSAAIVKLDREMKKNGMAYVQPYDADNLENKLGI